MVSVLSALDPSEPFGVDPQEEAREGETQQDQG